MTIPTPPPIPDRVVLGANGAYWRAFDSEPALDGLYSMCPNSTDNDPVVPVMTFLPVTETGAALVAALQKHKDRIQALQELVCTCDSKHIFQAVLHDQTCPVWLAAQEPPAKGDDR